ncbi:alpha/beta fold hydrolase [Deltaproteobacteria bacterium PRO3]|nr:alpha/beta fold hydrolase [Deltaproteobacteria bacterium PRO3]
MPKPVYKRKRLWIPLLLLAPVAALLIYLALNPIPHFRKTVNFLLQHVAGIEEQQARVGKRRVNYYEGGKENPRKVLLLHGFGGTAQMTWMRLMPALAKDYHVIAPDLLASSFLRLNPATYSVDSEVDLVLGLMQALNIEKADFVGLSVGGWVSLIIALEHPEKVGKLILVESAGLRTEIPELARLTLTDREKAKRFLELLFYNPPPLPGFVLDQLVKSSTRIKAKYEAVFMGFVENSKLRLLDNKVWQVRQPTLVIHGREDRVIPFEVGERLHRLIPGSAMVALEKSGHAPVWDQPTRLKNAILDFLAAPFPAESLPATTPAPHATPIP